MKPYMTEQEMQARIRVLTIASILQGIAIILLGITCVMMSVRI